MAEGNNRDLVLAPGTYAHILDRSKGHINCNVGPYKTTASETDVPVKWNGATYERMTGNIDQAIQPFTTVEEGHYVVLQNPAEDGKFPKEGTSSIATTLQIGRKINIAGPVSFPLWPGQTAKVIEGHHLRSNQYLIVRVYNDVQAKANWEKAVIKKTTGETSTDKIPDLVMGQLLVIKGTDVAFYIPPTGVEVVQDSSTGRYVHEAATLERLEYCILLDEDGNKRYVIGPDVVFPNPTEAFVVKDNSRRFRALELSEISGIHVKVIAAYEENGKKYQLGEELFITGKETPIYYPRPEHAIIKYDNREMHYAVAIPEGDARYVLTRVGEGQGRVHIVKGPRMFLPDPRTEVIIRRIVDPKMISYMYPGNSAALQHNAYLQSQTANSGERYISAETADSAQFLNTLSLTASNSISGYSANTTRGFSSQEVARKNVYTPPRTLTLDNKYDGVVNIQLWTGYAMLLVNSAGKRRVVVGPTNVQLEYDELPQVFELSTGKPKNTDTLLRTVYLKVKHNQVSDIIRVTTKDMVDVEIKVSYRVDFTGEPSEKWFSVDNYVKFLCDHSRSLLKNVAKSTSIDEFYGNGINVVRDTILGTAANGAKRTGRTFDENGMCIYDVEVLDIKIQNSDIADLLKAAQHNAVTDVIEVVTANRQLDKARKIESVNLEILALRTRVAEEQHTQTLAEAERRLAARLKDVTADTAVKLQRLQDELTQTQRQNEARLAEQNTLDSIAAATLARDAANREAQVKHLRAQAEVEVFEGVEKMKAVSPDLVASLKTFGDQAVLQKLADALAPAAMAQNVPVVDYMKNIFKGTQFESALDALGKKTLGY